MTHRPPPEPLGDAITALDTLTGGMTSVTAGYLLAAPRPTLIECGPARSIDNVVRGLHDVGLDPDDLAFLVVTHVHLDHAGGAGDLARAFPNATIVVSEVGARHLHDPERLNASAGQVYGELFDTVYGACTPIAQDRLLAVADGDTLDLGGGRRLEVLYTPGHAKHHVGLVDSDTGSLFSGDSVGVRLPGMRHLRPATPPPDFHFEAALRSLQRYQERAPRRLFLAHYGEVPDPASGLDEAIERLQLWTRTAEAAYQERSELDHVTETLRQRFQDEFDAATLEDDPDAERRVDLLSSYGSNAAGFLRYFRRRDEGSLTAVG